ncbi:MAG: tetratricopeptide repeat protein [Deltaproteobacteria bacterium]|nr:tetratricopeptide repeat protein [Deltaproteobacteria bacterium]MDZ4341759.1 tetratricopeptide repeat protein [Candidatus Binatia bacterium]
MVPHGSLTTALRQFCCVVCVIAILPSTVYRFKAAGLEPESIRAGRAAYARKDFRAALGHFREAAKTSPGTIQAQQWLAYMAAVMGEADEALGAYQNAALATPSSTSNYTLAMFAGEIGETRVAVEALEKSLSYLREHNGSAPSAKPNSYEVSQYLFRVLLEDRDRKRALSFARAQGWIREGVDYCNPPSSLKLSSETAALLAMLIHPSSAQCLLQAGKDLTENADYRLARFLLADLVQYSERPEIRAQAQAYIRQRLPAHDIAKRTEWLNGVATALSTRFRLPDEALKVFRKTIETDSRFAQPYYRIAYIHWEKKNHDEAVRWFRKALSIQPEHWRATYGMGCVLADQKKYQEALAYYRKAVTLNPQDADSFYNIGRVLLEMEDYEQALPAYQRAVALDPNDAYNRWGLSWVLHKLGRDNEAENEWRMAVRLDTKIGRKHRAK